MSMCLNTSNSRLYRVKNDNAEIFTEMFFPVMDKH